MALALAFAVAMPVLRPSPEVRAPRPSGGSQSGQLDGETRKQNSSKDIARNELMIRTASCMRALELRTRPNHDVRQGKNPLPPDRD